MILELDILRFHTSKSCLSIFLEIEKSFVNDIEIDRNDEAIIMTIISMAKTLRLDVVAEGVENIAQF
jgi:sensor c-di-GMP phosphodiesterase-like protein